MPEILRQLHEEHRNIARLLDALERQLAIFERAERILTPQDWAAVNAEAGQPNDPLFGAACKNEFAALREDVLRWERENQTA